MDRVQPPLAALTINPPAWQVLSQVFWLGFSYEQGNKWLKYSQASAQYYMAGGELTDSPHALCHSLLLL